MSIYTMRSGGTQHPEDTVLQHLTDVVTASGVLDTAGTQLKVTEDSPTGLSVLVAIGRAYIEALVGNAYPVRNDASYQQAITSNASGNPRIDALVLYIDLSATANTDASNVAKIGVVLGTPAASPVSPSDGTISTAIGAANPFIRLADITVASGATQILNADITDTRTLAILGAAGGDVLQVQVFS